MYFKYICCILLISLCNLFMPDTKQALLIVSVYNVLEPSFDGNKYCLLSIVIYCKSLWFFLKLL